MRKVYFMAKYFIQVTATYRINFLSLLIFPVLGIVLQFNPYLFQEVPVEEYFAYLTAWLAYMVTINAFTVGHQLVALRERQFLKQFMYITRDLKVVIFSLIFSQLFTLLTTVSILALTSTLLFKVSFIGVWLFSTGTVLLPFFPLCAVFLVLNLFPIHLENLQPIITVSTAFMLFSMNFMQVTEVKTITSILFNPMNFALEVGKIWGSNFFTSITFNTYGVMLSTPIFISIGFLAMKHSKINANFRV